MVITSSRPQFFYDSVALFFYNVLHPPPVPKVRKLDKYYDLGNFKLGSAIEESILYEILSGLRAATTDAASSSSTTPSITNMASIGKLLSEVASLTTAKSMVREDSIHGHDGHGGYDPEDFKDELNALNEDCYSRTSSTRESWGRCSTLGHSEDESITDIRGDDNDPKIFVTPMRSMRETLPDPNEGEKSQKKKKADTTKKLKKLESLS